MLLNSIFCYVIGVADQSILNPTVEIMDFFWAEPMTSATDFLVALISGYAAFRIYQIKKTERNPKVQTYFFLYFLFFAIGMTCAAWLGHGFQAYLSPRFKIIGWMLSATGLMFLQLASIQLISSKLKLGLFNTLKIVFVIQWIVLLILVINPKTSHFKVVQINSVLALIGTVLPIHIYNWKVLNNQFSIGVIIAIAYSLIPGLVYNNQVSYNRWFNYHDISHILIGIFMLMMFRSINNLARIDQYDMNQGE